MAGVVNVCTVCGARCYDMEPCDCTASESKARLAENRATVQGVLDRATMRVQIRQKLARCSDEQLELVDAVLVEIVGDLE